LGKAYTYLRWQTMGTGAAIAVASEGVLVRGVDADAVAIAGIGEIAEAEDVGIAVVVVVVVDVKETKENGRR